MKIIKASNECINEISTLFDMYRQYYGKKSDIIAAKNFISDRLKNNDSIIFSAFNNDNKIIGFTKVYFLSHLCWLVQY